MQYKYSFKAILQEIPNKGGAYIIFPYDIKKEFGKGRIKVYAEFNGIPYKGSIVNMGVKDKHGNICYILGVLKSIRNQLNVSNGDILDVLIEIL